MYYFRKRFRDVAQSGRVLVWGASGRRFKSCHPDDRISSTYVNVGAFFISLCKECYDI